MASSIKNIIFAALLITTLTKAGLSEFTSLSKVDSLKLKLQTAVEDTSKIQLLFGIGNCYLDGPSDSLIFYYQIALEKIEDFFAQPKEDLTQTNKRTLLIYKQYHFRALNEIGIEKFFLGQYNESLEYAFSALSIAEDLDDIGMISECCGAIGIVYKNQGKYPEALDFYIRALDLAIELNDTAWMAACYANTANVYRRLGNFANALNYLLKAYEVFEKSGEKRRMSIGLMNIGNLYEDQGDDKKALEYYSRALQISYETEDYKRIAECLLNVGNIYLNWNNYPLAREYYEKSLSIHKEQGFMHTLDDCYRNIGNAYEKEKNYFEALNYYNMALELGEKEDDKATISEVQGSISGIYIRNNNFTKGLEYAVNSLRIAQQTGDLQNQKNAYELVSKAYEGLNNTSAAFENYKNYTRIKDSLFNSDKYRVIKEIEAKYELEKKEQQLALLTEKNQVQKLTLSRRNRVIVTSLGTILLVIIIGYILIRNNRLKAKNQAIELEQRLLRSQMNPHFIFNSLMAIQSYIYKSDPVQAGDFLAKFADLVRTTLENSRVEFVLLENEIKMLQIYLELQSLRFENKFNHTIHIQKDIDVSAIRIPPMLAQPFIENAIEHGLRHKAEIGFIKLNYYIENSYLVFTVEDNGIGREKARKLEINKKHQAMATFITKERLALLSKRFKQDYVMELIDLKDESGLPKGTLVKLTMPFLHME
jgi:tetratricopeptide (TPR) repeat protein